MKTIRKTFKINRSKSFGQKETCVFANDGEFLKRRAHNGVAGKGMLMPLSNCPVWSNEK